MILQNFPNQADRGLSIEISHCFKLAIGSSYPWMFFLPADRKTKPDSVVVDFSLQEKEFQWLTHACKSTFKWWNTWNVYRTHVFVCTNADTLSYLCPIFYLTIYAGCACDNAACSPRWWVAKVVSSLSWAKGWQTLRHREELGRHVFTGRIWWKLF